MLLHGTVIIPSNERICTSDGESGAEIVPVIVSPVMVWICTIRPPNISNSALAQPTLSWLLSSFAMRLLISFLSCLSLFFSRLFRRFFSFFSRARSLLLTRFFNRFSCFFTCFFCEFSKAVVCWVHCGGQPLGFCLGFCFFFCLQRAFRQACLFTTCAFPLVVI